MKKIIFILSFFLLLNCTNTKKVYWCGDHPCLNNKEKTAYFKKNMTVEVREINKKDIKKDSKIKEIMNQAKINEKERIKNEKKIKKQTRIDQKQKNKVEKKQAKQARLNEKKELKEKKKKDDLNKNSNIDSYKTAINSDDDFDFLVEKITKRNNLKPYPDINGIAE
tara:strand:- start:5681 stop:6178 length:498 start_codon:yes stop_codon:yes gene_type:complete